MFEYLSNALPCIMRRVVDATTKRYCSSSPTYHPCKNIQEIVDLLSKGSLPVTINFFLPEERSISVWYIGPPESPSQKTRIHVRSLGVHKTGFITVHKSPNLGRTFRTRGCQTSILGAVAKIRIEKI